MRIALAAPTDVNALADLAGQPSPGEVHKFPLTAEIARAYVEAGHQVRVIVQSRGGGGVGSVYGTSDFSVAIVPARRASRAVPDWFRVEVAAVRTAISDWEPDVVHAHWTYEYARGAIASGVPHLVTAHDVPSRLFSLMKPRYYWWPKLLQGYVVSRRAQRMTAQSPYTLQCWQKEMGRKSAIDLVPNGVSQDVLALGAGLSDKRSLLFASVCTGFGERKNAKTLLRAFAMVRKSEPSARLRMYGSEYGPSEAAYAWAESQGLTDGVEFVGHGDRMMILQALRDEVATLVHPSLEESFGMSVAEAMAVGLPVVGGKEAGAVPWLLDDGRAGLVCDVRDPNSVAAAMLDSLHRPDLGAAAYARVRREFTLDMVTSRYLQILIDVAASAKLGTQCSPGPSLDLSNE